MMFNMTMLVRIVVVILSESDNSTIGMTFCFQER